MKETDVELIVFPKSEHAVNGTEYLSASFNQQSSPISYRLKAYMERTIYVTDVDRDPSDVVSSVFDSIHIVTSTNNIAKYQLEKVVIQYNKNDIYSILDEDQSLLEKNMFVNGWLHVGTTEGQSFNYDLNIYKRYCYTID
jgi:hypothetical protein